MLRPMTNLANSAVFERMFTGPVDRRQLRCRRVMHELLIVETPIQTRGYTRGKERQAHCGGIVCDWLFPSILHIAKWHTRIHAQHRIQFFLQREGYYETHKKIFGNRYISVFLGWFSVNLWLTHNIGFATYLWLPPHLEPRTKGYLD